MYLSKIYLDPMKRDTARALQDRALFHSIIERTVEGERPHILWRLEDDMTLLAVSKDIPYLGDLQARFGNARKKPMTQVYDRYIDSLKNGDVLKIKITVNPVIRKKRGQNGNSKDTPLNLRPTPNYPYCAQDWIKQKLTDKGAEVLSISDTRHNDTYFTSKHQSQKIPLFIVTYEGVICVENETLFREAMFSGIGGKKTYGCGMMTAIKIGTKRWDS